MTQEKTQVRGILSKILGDDLPDIIMKYMIIPPEQYEINYQTLVMLDFDPIYYEAEIYGYESEYKSEDDDSDWPIDESTIRDLPNGEWPIYVHRFVDEGNIHPTLYVEYSRSEHHDEKRRLSIIKYDMEKKEWKIIKSYFMLSPLFRHYQKQDEIDEYLELYRKIFD